MRIAIINYHLIRGGVSSVIRNQARALADSGDAVLVLAGEVERSIPDFGRATLEIVPTLRSDSRRPSGGGETCESLAGDLIAAMEKHWGALPDLVHFHNPLLRKNSLLNGAMRVLKDRGIPLLLQVHDFAEEFRPDLYVTEPYLEDVHYAVVNGRDFSFLRRAGLVPEGLHLLPPSVTPVEAVEGRARTRYLYPVRASSRKNIGEALLLSLFIPSGCTIGLTLPPASPRDHSAYAHWKDLASRYSLPVEFDLGERETLPELFGSSVCSITTSAKEGFGFSFLEPWTAGRAVIGRRIDHLCRDFERAGVSFSGLYSSIDIPVVYLPVPLMRHKMEAALERIYRAYDFAPPPFAVKMLDDDLVSRSGFDFGRLGEDLQTEMIETLAANAAAREDLSAANPFLTRIAELHEGEESIALNKERILAAYSLPPALMRLKSAYRSVVERPLRHRISKSVLLELFLDPLKMPIAGVAGD